MTSSHDTFSRLAHLPAACAALAALFLLSTATGLCADIPPADLFRQATAALNDGNYPLAEQRFVQYLAVKSAKNTDEESRLALSHLCHALAGQRRYADILGLLDKNADIVAAGDDRLFTYWRAYALLESGNPASALDLIDPVARLSAKTNDTANLNLMRLAADAYFRLGTPDADARARESVDAFLRSAPDADPALPLDGARLLQARLFLREGNREKAIATFTGIASNETAGAALRANALVNLVDLAATNSPAALEYAERLARLPLGKSATDYLIRCGRILASRPSTAEAGARYLKKAVRDNSTSPQAPDAQFALAEAWLSAGSNDLAAAEFKTYLETYGMTPGQAARATIWRAEALFRLEDFYDAATLFQKAAQTTTNALLTVALGIRAADALYANDNYESAAALYRASYDRPEIEAEPGSEAKDIVKRLYTDAPSGAEFRYLANRSRFQEADCLERCGQAADAQKRFATLATDAGPFTEDALYRSALLLERKGGDVESGNAAIASYTGLITSTTNLPLKCRALLGRGRCHYRRKSLQVAIDDFRAAEQAGFDSADEAELYHIYALYALGQDDKASKRAEDFAARAGESPVLPTLSLWLAQYRYNVGDFEKARTHFLDFASRWPDDSRAPLALLWAAKSALRLSDNQGAVDILAALGKRNDADALLPEARYTQATALCNLARFEDAVLVLDDATVKFPSSEFATRSLILKGDAIFSLGGSAKSNYGVTNAITAYDIAATRTDATPDMRLECFYKRARCLEKAGNPSAADRYYNDVITPFYALAEEGNVQASTISFYERAVFACALLKERQGKTDEAIGILRRLVEYDTPEREPALREIERLQNIRK